MNRTWQMQYRNYKGHLVNATSDGVVVTNGPMAAIRYFGFDDPCYVIRYSRKGYGHYTGRVEIFAPETWAAQYDSRGFQCRLLSPDFVLKVID